MKWKWVKRWLEAKLDDTAQRITELKEDLRKTDGRAHRYREDHVSFEKYTDRRLDAYGERLEKIEEAAPEGGPGTMVCSCDGAGTRSSIEEIGMRITKLEKAHADLQQDLLRRTDQLRNLIESKTKA